MKPARRRALHRRRVAEWSPPPRSGRGTCPRQRTVRRPRPPPSSTTPPGQRPPAGPSARRPRSRSRPSRSPPRATRHCSSGGWTPRPTRSAAATRRGPAGTSNRSSDRTCPVRFGPRRCCDGPAGGGEPGALARALPAGHRGRRRRRARGGGTPARRRDDDAVRPHPPRARARPPRRRVAERAGETAMLIESLGTLCHYETLRGAGDPRPAGAGGGARTGRAASVEQLQPPRDPGAPPDVRRPPRRGARAPRGQPRLDGRDWRRARPELPPHPSHAAGVPGGPAGGGVGARARGARDLGADRRVGARGAAVRPVAGGGPSGRRAGGP